METEALMVLFAHIRGLGVLGSAEVKILTPCASLPHKWY